MSSFVLDKIEYVVLLVAQFANRLGISEPEAYCYLKKYDALALCDKHYGIMHTLSVEDNIDTLTTFCRKKGGQLHRI